MAKPGSTIDYDFDVKPPVLRVMKWMLTVNTVLVVAVWAATLWIFAAYNGIRFGVRAWHGVIELKDGGPPFTRTRIAKRPAPPMWEYDTSNSNRETVSMWFAHFSFPSNESWLVPLWPFVLLSGVPAGIMWGQDICKRKRSRWNLCPHCGFDLRGLAGGALCPECGKLRIT